MSICLGLARVKRLLQACGDAQQLRTLAPTVHVGGTNGKGSVCAFMASCLMKAGLNVARFNSPHLIDRWDCIVFGNEAISENEFLELESRVQRANADLKIEATPFEVLTVVAFESFKLRRPDIVLLEVGMGGLRDATNVITSPTLSIITSIALDHQKFLGDTIEQIAREKAGIMKHGQPLLVDGLNSQNVMNVLREEAHKIGVSSFSVSEPVSPLSHTFQSKVFGEVPLPKQYRGTYQVANMSIAIAALEHLKHNFDQLTPKTVSTGLSTTIWPGRLDRRTLITPKSRTEIPILFDGAHNIAAAQSLSAHISVLRKDAHNGITWLLGFSAGRSIEKMVQALGISSADSVAVLEFHPVDSMPWVHSENAGAIKQLITQMHPDIAVESFATDAGSALEWCLQHPQPIVCTGSLYLVGQLLKGAGEKVV